MPSEATETPTAEMPGKDASRSLTVALEDRGYDIVIGPGLLHQAGALIAVAVPDARVAIVTDKHVAGLHLETLKAALAETGSLIGQVVLPAGESSKSFSQLDVLCHELLGLGVERGDVVVALGGGVIGDLAGFAASIVRRGVRVVQIPTTLLAQVDSSVGGKTGINSPRGKNLIGAFHQPSLVLADISVLATLPDRQFRAGYAEVAKYGLLGDAEFFDWLEENWPAVFRREPEALARIVGTSCRAKADVVAADEYETGNRALLNLGHTFGHALEAWAGFSDKLLHGEAIAIGMAQAFRYSMRAGLVGDNQVRRVESHLQAVGLPITVADIPGPAVPEPDALLSLMAQDKKVRRGQLVFVLVRGIGEAFVCRDVDENALRAFVADECGKASS
ncbi:MAG: 3-dehydroquinate synthase [Hyphomicrobiaceae bacterium]